MGMSSDYVAEFREAFPDLPESLYTANQDMARDLLQQMRQAAAADEANAHERVVRHLCAQFPQLSEATVFDTISSHGWDVDAASVALVELAMNPPAPEELEIVQMFCDQFPRERILELYAQNEGDAEATANALLDEGAGAAGAALAQQREEQQRRAIVQDLSARFDGLSTAEVEAALAAAAWDVEAATATLVGRAEVAFVDKLKASFPEFAERQIRRVIYAADWNLRRAKELLRERRAETAQEAEKEALERQQRELHSRSLVVSTGVTERLRQKKAQMEERIRAELEEELQRRFGPHAGEAAVAEDGPVADEEKEEPEQKDSPVGGGSAGAVVPGRQVRLSAHSPRVDAGQAVEVVWEVEGEMEASGADWVGLYRRGREDAAYTTYQWLPSGGRRGTLTFYPKKDGHYEFRAFADRSMVRMGVSAEVRVGAVYALTVEQFDEKRVLVKTALTEGPPASGAWIGLYPAGQENNRSYQAYQYRDSTGSQAFDVPRVGAWELRLFTNSSYHAAATARIVLEGDNSLQARRDGATVVVTLRTPTLNALTDRVWVGIFFADADIASQSPRRWKWVRNDAAELLFSCPRTPGTYHVRLFAQRGLRPILLSDAFDVTA